MNENRKPGEQGAKRKYIKPELSAVPLRPEEAVLGYCKGPSHSGPGGSGTCSSPSACSSTGS